MVNKKYARFTRFRPAMEAEDISATAQQNQKSLLGPTSNTENTDEDDIENTTDILGTKSGNNNASPQGGEDASPSEDRNMDTTEGGDTEEMNEGGEEEDGTDNMDESGDDDSDSSEESDEPDVDLLTPSEEDINIQRKENLRKAMIQLYNTLTGNIQNLKDNNLSSTKKEDIQIMNSIIENLEDANQVLYDTITGDYKNTAYAEARKKYVGAQKVYDISIKMLYQHFDNLQKEAKEGKSKKNKSEMKKKDA